MERGISFTASCQAASTLGQTSAGKARCKGITPANTARTIRFATRLFIPVLLLLASLNGHTQWIPNPTQNNAVCSATADQVNVQITSDGAGGAIYVWEDYRNTLEVYAQRIDASGNRLWAADGVAISTGGDSRLPKITTDGAGGAIITWYDNRSGIGADIYAQRINAGGIAQWTVNGVPVCTAASNQTQQQIISDGAGGAYIIWSDGRVAGTASADIYAQRINSVGVAQWAANGTAICAAFSTQFSPQLVSDGAGGFIATWTDTRRFGQNDIYAQRFSSNGFKYWQLDGVPVCSEASFFQENPQIIAAPNNSAIICWEDMRNSSITQRDIYAQKIDGNGSPRWTFDGIPVCEQGNIQYTPKMIEDGLGGVMLVWADRRTGVGNDDIYAQHFDGNGNALWAANGLSICTASNTQKEPQLVANATGAYIIWTDFRNAAQEDIYAQHITTAGSLDWMANGLPVSNEIHSQTTPQCIADGNNNLIAAWQDNRNTTGLSNYDIYSSRLLANGTLPLHFLSFSAVTKNNEVLLSWDTENEINTSHFEIEFSTDGQHFSTKGKASSKNTPGINHYSFTHISPASDPVFYRLKQVDSDGQFAYSKIVQLNVQRSTKLLLYPNPATHFIQVRNSKAETIREIQITSADGKRIMTFLPGNSMQYDISRMKPGIYLLQLIKKDRSITIMRFEKF